MPLYARYQHRHRHRDRMDISAAWVQPPLPAAVYRREAILGSTFNMGYAQAFTTFLVERFTPSWAEACCRRPIPKLKPVCLSLPVQRALFRLGPTRMLAWWALVAQGYTQLSLPSLDVSWCGKAPRLYSATYTSPPSRLQHSIASTTLCFSTSFTPSKPPHYLTDSSLVIGGLRHLP